MNDVLRPRLPDDAAPVAGSQNRTAPESRSLSLLNPAAASSPPISAKVRSRVSMSSSVTTEVSSAMPLGTPALVGAPKVTRPEPAFTSSPSLWPW